MSLRLSKVSVNNFAGNVAHIAGNERKFWRLTIAFSEACSSGISASNGDNSHYGVTGTDALIVG